MTEFTQVWEIRDLEDVGVGEPGYPIRLIAAYADGLITENEYRERSQLHLALHYTSLPKPLIPWVEEEAVPRIVQLTRPLHRLGVIAELDHPEWVHAGDVIRFCGKQNEGALVKNVRPDRTVLLERGIGAGGIHDQPAGTDIYIASSTDG